MEILDELIAKRIQYIENEIVAGAFNDKKVFEAEVERFLNVMTTTAVMKSIDKEKARNYFEENFAPKVMELYQKYNAPESEIQPDKYAFDDKQSEIEDLIKAGNLDEADRKIDEFLSMLEDEDIVSDSINDGIFTHEDVDYFKNVACSNFDKLKEEQMRSMPQKQGLAQRIKNGFVFMATGKNPYDNQTVKVKKEKLPLNQRIKESSFGKWAKRHKVAVYALGAAALVGAGITVGKWFLHNQAESLSSDTGQTGASQTVVEEMATFEVDEYHNFNINDQEVHTEKLQLLAQAIMERGVPVVSEEECMRMGQENQLAVSPEQLNNWLISVNLEDMSDLTFTKLLADSNTDKEELSSDFIRVSNILSSIYTTKEESPFIYQFLSSKESSESVKAYEEAIIENQKGNSESLITLIKSRIETAVLPTSSGPLGMLSSCLIYQQANVYNAEVVGQDIIDLYNINNDCSTSENQTSTFFSDDWAEYMRKVNFKFDAAISYTGSEVEAYIQYIVSLGDTQDDNKVYIEEQVLPYLEAKDVQLGEWDVLENIENNNNEVRAQGTGSNGNSTITTPKEVEVVKTVIKEPTTEAEKEVQAEVEAALEKENEASFNDVIKEYTDSHNGITNVTEDGDTIIFTPDGSPITVDKDTMGAYNPSKDYHGTVYGDYGDYMSDHRGQIEHVDGVGDVVVTEESQVVITNPNVYIDANGDIINKDTGNRVVTGTEEEIDEILDRYPGLSDWVNKGESGIHYSEVDDDLYQDDRTNGILNGGTSSRPSGGSTGSVLDSVDQGVLDSLTPEEQAELEEMLNAGKEPVAGEIVDEEYSDIVYGSYTVPQLMNNPALCQNIPESILRNQFPEIWNVYQNWLSQQSQTQVSAQSDSTQIVSSDITITQIEAQKAALEEVRAELTSTEEVASLSGPEKILQ
ncbi:MAG: hypothetical protein HFH08_03130 [Bacilli bacterium]|nr:hypothetical protein [Bacilli bacterium]